MPDIKFTTNGVFFCNIKWKIYSPHFEAVPNKIALNYMWFDSPSVYLLIYIWLVTNSRQQKHALGKPGTMVPTDIPGRNMGERPDGMSAWLSLGELSVCQKIVLAASTALCRQGALLVISQVHPVQGSTAATFSCTVSCRRYLQRAQFTLNRIFCNYIWPETLANRILSFCCYLLLE